MDRIAALTRAVKDVHGADALAFARRQLGVAVPEMTQTWAEIVARLAAGE